MKGRILYRNPRNRTEYYFAGLRSGDDNSLIPVGSMWLRPNNAVIFDSRSAAEGILAILSGLGIEAKFEKLFP